MNASLFFNICLTISVLVIVSFLWGTVIDRIANRREGILLRIVWGFISLISIFQIVEYPFYSMELSFSILYWLFLVIVLFVSIIGFIIQIGDQRENAILRQLKYYCRTVQNNKYIVLLYLLSVLFLFYLSFVCIWSSSDDSYYMARTLEIIAQDNVGVSHTMSWLGEKSSCWPDVVDVSSYECFKAFLSRLFKIHPTILAKNVLAFFSIIINQIITLKLFNEIKQRGEIGITFLSLTFYNIILAVGFKVVNSKAYWMVRHSSSGKSLMCLIIFPAILLLVTYIITSPTAGSKGNWILLFLVLVAGIGVSIMGVIFSTLMVSVCGMAYLIFNVNKFRQVIFPFIVSIIPCIFWGIISLIQVSNNNFYDHMTETIGMTGWMGTLLSQISGDNKYIILLYLLSIIFIIIKRDRTALILFGGIPIVLFSTFLNPLFVNVVVKYVTSSETYIRLYWMLPLYICPAYSLGILIGRIRKEQLDCAIIGIIGTIIVFSLCGIHNIGRTNYFHAINRMITGLSIEDEDIRFRENAYCVWPDCYEIVETISKSADGQRKKLLSIEECYIRQYTPEIIIAGGVRDEQKAYNTSLIDGMELSEADFFLGIKEKGISSTQVKEAIDKLSIDYLLIPNSYEDTYNFEDMGYEEILDNGYSTLWSCR